jgi:DNA-directed RNA polymerase specialized sigma24 family protein
MLKDAEIRRKVFAYLFQRCKKHEQDTEEVLQETYARAWKTQVVPDNPVAWFISLTHYPLIEHYRKLGVEPREGETDGKALRSVPAPDHSRQEDNVK